MSCCVCKAVLATAVGKNRHKKLNGGKFDDGKATLAACVEQCCKEETLASLGLEAPSCVVCYLCIKKLKKIADLEKDLKAFKSEIAKNFFSGSQGSSTPQQEQVRSGQIAIQNLFAASTPQPASQESSSTVEQGTEPRCIDIDASPIQIAGSTPRLVVEEESTPQRLGEEGRNRRRAHAGNKRPRAPQSSNELCPHPKQFKVIVTVDFECGTKNYLITPRREDTVVQIARRSYNAMAGSVVHQRCDETINALAKKINREIDYVCSNQSNTIFDKDCDEVEFSWDTMWDNIEKYLPTLLSLIVSICARKVNRPMICMIVFMLLKQRFHKLSYLQQTISVMLYGNTVHKEVFNCLQPLMVSMSYMGTLNLLERTSKKFDLVPKSWKDCLTDHIQEREFITDRKRVLQLLRSSKVTSSESNGAHEANDVDDWDGLFQDIIASGDESNPECDRDSDPRGDDCTDDEHGENDERDCAVDVDFTQTANEVDYGFECDFGDLSEERINGESDKVDCSSDNDDLRQCSQEMYEFEIDSADVSTMTQLSFSAPPYSPCEPFDDMELFLDGINWNDVTAINVVLPSALVDSTSSSSQPQSASPAATGSCQFHNANLTEHQSSQIQCPIVQGWKGFKIVGDNIDKNIRPSFQRYDNNTTSLHYFHHYAVLDRVDLSNHSEALPEAERDLNGLVVGVNDVTQLESDTVVLLSRILVQHLDQYKTQAKGISWHIPSKFTKEMSSKSVVVPLGIIRKNENVLTDMCDILHHFHQFVPTKSEVQQLDGRDPNNIVTKESFLFHRVLLGGDQLTIARCRGSIAARCDHPTLLERFRGIVPVTEDWHAKRTYLMAIYKILYKKESKSEKATLAQLKILINNSANIDPEKDMKACEDFFRVSLYAHVIAAAKSILRERQFNKVEDLAKEIIKRFVYFSPDVTLVEADKKHLYALQILTLLLVWHGFDDAIHEGDGDRVLTYWKFLAVAFKVTRHSNYFKEAVILQLQYHYLLPEREAEQLKWSRFVNTIGKTGCNVSCDLHIEHLNRRLKGMMGGMRGEKHAIDRAAKSIGFIHNICEKLNQETGHNKTNTHKTLSSAKECSMIVDELMQQDIFMQISGRSHSSFKNIRPILQQAPSELLLPYIIEKLKTYQL